MSSGYLNINGWREILARVFADCKVQFNVSPPWLINPATRRRLKLDYLYPEIDVAVRITGITAKGQGRRSDVEAMDDHQRDQTREELCRINGVQLVVIDPFDDPVKQMDALLRILSRASRLLAESNETKKRKQAGMDALGKAHQQATSLRSRLTKQPDQVLASLAEGWRDREAGLAVELQQAATQVEQKKPSALAIKKLAALQSGQRVVHNHYGDGVVMAIDGEGADQKITILFDADKERTFLLDRVADKLRPHY
jgi:transcription-repair coupling factor (superfamily II helicase)